jgi:hypothetical protein
VSQSTFIEPFDSAGVASAEEGSVVLDGPDGIAITLTAEAARQTGLSLMKAAEEARLQIVRRKGG